MFENPNRSSFTFYIYMKQVRCRECGTLAEQSVSRVRKDASSYPLVDAWQPAQPQVARPLQCQPREQEPRWPS